MNCMDSDYFPHPLSLRAETAMSQETAYELCRLFGFDLKVDQAISGMAQPSTEKILIAREEGWTAKRVKKPDNLVVIVHAKPADFATDASKMNAPTIKPLALPDVQVFV